MFLISLLVFVVFSAVIVGVNILRNKIIFGDYDNAINSFGDNYRFNPRSTLNKFLNAKYLCYWKLDPQPIRWLIFYSNYLLPLISLLSATNVIYSAITGAFQANLQQIVYLLFAASCLFNVVTIRGIDKLAFYFNFIPSGLLLAYISVPFDGISVFYLVVFVPFLAGNLYYFIRRRGLFLVSLRQMKYEVSLLDDQNAS